MQNVLSVLHHVGPHGFGVPEAMGATFVGVVVVVVGVGSTSVVGALVVGVNIGDGVVGVPSDSKFPLKYPRDVSECIEIEPDANDPPPSMPVAQIHSWVASMTSFKLGNVAVIDRVTTTVRLLDR